VFGLISCTYKGMSNYHIGPHRTVFGPHWVVLDHNKRGLLPVTVIDEQRGICAPVDSEVYVHCSGDIKAIQSFSYR